MAVAVGCSTWLLVAVTRTEMAASDRIAVTSATVLTRRPPTATDVRRPKRTAWVETTVRPYPPRWRPGAPAFLLRRFAPPARWCTHPARRAARLVVAHDEQCAGAEVEDHVGEAIRVGAGRPAHEDGGRRGQ